MMRHLLTSKHCHRCLLRKEFILRMERQLKLDEMCAPVIITEVLHFGIKFLVRDYTQPHSKYHAIV
jgi:hypothetical protein